jgi:predicted transcriptional regulator
MTLRNHTGTQRISSQKGWASSGKPRRSRRIEWQGQKKHVDDKRRLIYCARVHRHPNMKAQPGVGRAEMEILRYVAEHHPITVGAVAEHFAETKGYVRTTLLNTMERLREKGYLVRKRVDGVFHYSPRVPKADLFRGLVRDFVQSALSGSVSPFVAYLTEAKVSDAELEELKRLVRELEAQRKEGGK